jgi:formiminotetrahydrofolate cyclodeaminase
MPYITYLNKSLKIYLDDLAAKKPAPGGGSAAALAGALGCALLSMACNYTIGRPKSKNVEKQIKGILRRTEVMRRRFLALVDLDVQAYYKVFKRRKGNPRIYQRNLVAATKVPLEICRLAQEGYCLCPVLLKTANKYLLSDVRAGQALLKSCFQSARFNVIINIPLIKDKKFIRRFRKAISSLKMSIRVKRSI